MNHEYMIVAKKYAHAVLNIWGDQFDITAVYNCRRLIEYLSTHRQIGFFLKMSLLDEQVKRSTLQELCDRFTMPRCFSQLLEHLEARSRCYLLEDIVRMICVQYLSRAGIIEFEFITAHPFSQADAQVMQQFLVRKTGKTIIYTSRIDRSLIAGVRLISTTILWQYSIADQLRRITTTVSE